MKNDKSTITADVSDILQLSGHQAVPVSAGENEGQYINVRGDQRTIYLPPNRKQPRFKRASVVFRDAKDFVAYVNEHKSVDCSRIFLDTGKPADGVTATAIIDYHTPALMGGNWGLHRATLLAPLHDDLKAWMEERGESQGQEQFALFIEDHADNVLNPKPTTLISMALKLQGSLTGNYTANIDLDRANAKLHFEQEQGTGDVEVPRIIELYTPMFAGGNAEHFKVNLAMKVAGGRPTFIWRMPGLTNALRDAARHLRDMLATDTSLPVYEASAPTGMEAMEIPVIISQPTYAPAPSTTVTR